MELKAKVAKAQRNEITEYHIYRKLAARSKNPKKQKTS